MIAARLYADTARIQLLFSVVLILVGALLDPATDS